MNKIKKIGLFDSGMGGLSILQDFLRKYPGKNFVYFADTANLPYGEKNKEELRNCCTKIQNFLLSLDVSALVIACNAASCLYVDKKKYKNIPLINVISPTIKKLMEVCTEGKKVGIIATPFTVKSNIYFNTIKSLDPSLNIFQRSAPDLAPLVEKGWERQECKTALRKNLEPLLQKNIDVLVLACTHYFFLKEEIKQILPAHIQIIDPLSHLGLNIQNKIQRTQNLEGIKDLKMKEKKNLENAEHFKEKKNNSNVQIYMTQRQPKLEETARQMMKRLQTAQAPQITVLNSF